jgi:TetR/AcrR family transcriptional regulator
MGTVARKEREKQKRREDILTAARELFYEKGYQMTTVEEIAEAAEISKGTVYLYFGSKDELYVSVILEGFGELEKKMVAVVESPATVNEKVFAIFTIFIDHCLDHREYFRLTQYFMSESVRENLPRELRDTIDDHSNDLLEVGSRVVREGIEAGIFRPDLDPYAASVIAWRTLTGLMDLIIFNGPGADGSRGEKLFNTAMELFMRGAGNPGNDQNESKQQKAKHRV